MSDPDDELVDFADEGAEPPLTTGERSDAPDESAGRVWRVLVVDDDEDVHQATEFSLGALRILGRPLKFLHAYSSLEAIDILMEQKDVAVILLDVVMENPDAGLAAVGVIRRDLGLGNAQIILRTGQPGYAPEIETIRRYDINDYRTKSELTRTKLYTVVTAGIRIYDQLTRMAAARAGLEQAMLASTDLIAQEDRKGFLDSVLRHGASLLGVPLNVLLVSADARMPQAYRVTAASGASAPLLGRSLEALDGAARDGIGTALAARRTIVDDKGITLFFPGRRAPDSAAFFPDVAAAPVPERHLLEVFCNVVAAAGENIALVGDLTRFAYVDPLTGLGTRRAFIQAIDKRIAAPEVRERTSICLIDIDQFAEINDALGHGYGDRLLLSIAERLRSAVDAECAIARIGGDTFGVAGDAEHVRAEILRPLFQLPVVIDGDERPISASLALVDASLTEGDGLSLLKDATIVLKRAKANGQGQVAHYSTALGAESRERNQMLYELRRGIHAGELFLVYQPQLDLASGRVVGVEALARWRNSRGEMVPPDRFIPIAEQSGLILQMGEHGLDVALRDVARVHQAGHVDVRVAVNVSAGQFRHRGMVDHISHALRERGLAPSCLELEITESVALMGMEFVVQQLTRLRELGLAIAIDDFGTGYSSLSYLDRLPVDRLKIDRAFVWALDTANGSARIAEMVVPLGHALGLKVLAEGVESEAQADRLRAMGCDEVQGYLYGRPMPIDDLLTWLAARG